MARVFNPCRVLQGTQTLATQRAKCPPSLHVNWVPNRDGGLTPFFPRPLSPLREDNIMKRAIIVISFLLVLGQQAAQAQPHVHSSTKIFIWSITPYGDFCPKSSAYGSAQQDSLDGQAADAARSYFAARGMEITNIKQRGRFMFFDVLKQRQLVDQVIFDRATGRLRSIH